jgi:hypothetical protein
MLVSTIQRRLPRWAVMVVTPINRLDPPDMFILLAERVVNAVTRVQLPSAVDNLQARV